MNNWHIITVTHGGTVSILRNLDEATAKEAARRLDPWRNRPIGVPYYISDADIVRVELLGPEN